MRNALLGFFVLVVLLVGGLLIAPSFVDWDKYKAQGLAQAKSLSGYDIEIGGDFSLAFLPFPHVKAQDVKVINPAVSIDPLASFDALSVSVALTPLLKGAVQVSEISLVKPVFDIRLDKGGKGNWLSPEIETLMAQKDEGVKAADASKAGPDVSFDKIKIEGGRFRFADAGKGSVSEVEDIGLVLKAESLQGPFDADGSAVFGGEEIRFAAKTSEIDTEASGFSLNAKVEQGDYVADYKGAVTFTEPFEAQGEVELSAASLPGLAQAILVKGFVTANQERIALKDTSLQIGEQSYQGHLNLGLKPFAVKAAFDGKGVLDLDTLLPKPVEKKQTDLNAVLDVLPNTVTLPQAFEADIALSSGGVLYNKALIKNVGVTFSKQGTAFKGKVTADDIPGRGPAVVDADLVFAEKSVSKGGAEVYSDPKLNAVIQANTQNTGETVKAFTGQEAIPVLSTSRIGKFYIKVEAVPGRVGLGESIINLDDLKVLASGSLKRGKGKNPLFTVNVNANELDFDTLIPKKPDVAAANDAAPTDALRNLSLPVDVDFDVSVNKAMMNGQNIQGLKAAGAVRADTISLSKFGASDFAGASLDVSGKIGSLKAMSGIDFDIRGAASDPYKTAKAFDVDTSKLPQNLGGVKVSAKVSGSLIALDTNTSVSALGGDLRVEGQVQNPLSAPAFSNIAVQVKHPNMAKALQSFGASAPAYASFSKPLDFSAKVGTDGKVTSLSGINAKFAGTDMTGNLRFDGSAAVPSLSGALKFGRLELVSAAGAGGGGGSGGGRSSSGGGSGGKWPNDKIDTGFLHAVNADFDVSADSILYEKWDMKAPLLKMQVSGGTLDVKDLQAGLFDGKIAASGQVSAAAAKDAPLSLSGAAKIMDVDLEALAFALSGSKQLQAEGKASLSINNIRGAGNSARAIVGTLSGDATLTGRTIVMKGFDLGQLASALLDSHKPLPRIQQLVGSATSGGQTAFDTVDGAYAINKGVVSISSMVMDGPAARIVSEGSVNLPRWRIDSDHTITLKNAPDVAPFEVAINGDLDNPGNTFGRGLFESYFQQKLLEKVPDLLGNDVSEKLQKFGILPGAGRPAAPVPAPNATEPAAGGGNGGAAQPVQQQQRPQSVEEQAEDAIKGVLKGLLQ